MGEKLYLLPVQRSDSQWRLSGVSAVVFKAYSRNFTVRRSVTPHHLHEDYLTGKETLTYWYSHWGEYIQERTVDSNTGRRFYTRKRVRSAYFSIKRNRRWLWTFYDLPEAHLPNTNNEIEALFTDLKTKLRVHNGLSKRSRKIVIDEYFRQNKVQIAQIWAIWNKKIALFDH